MTTHDYEVLDPPADVIAEEIRANPLAATGKNRTTEGKARS